MVWLDTLCVYPYFMEAVLYLFLSNWILAEKNANGANNENVNSQHWS